MRPENSISFSPEIRQRNRRRKVIHRSSDSPRKIPSQSSSPESSLREEQEEEQTEETELQSQSQENSNDKEEEKESTANENAESETVEKTPYRTDESSTVEPSVNSATSPDFQIPNPQSTYLNIAPLPIFKGESGECPVAHLSRFSKVCRANNASSPEMLIRIFPVTLDGEAALWYELNIESNPDLSWEEIKSNFVQTYLITEFVDQSRSELMMIRQGETESVKTFYLRMQWILKKWPDHGIPELILKGIFIDGLREDFQDWIIPRKPNSLKEALRLAFDWEQAQSIRAARRRNLTGYLIPSQTDPVKCGFCEGLHEEQNCEIRKRLKELWVKSLKGKEGCAELQVSARKCSSKAAPSCSPKYSDDIMATKSFQSPGTSSFRQQAEEENEGVESLASKRRSQCQCLKHQCWKKNGRSN